MGRFLAHHRRSRSRCAGRACWTIGRPVRCGGEIVGVGRDESGRTVALNGDLGGQDGRQCRALSAGNDQRERAEIERGLFVVAFLDGREEFVAETQIQSEARSYFEIIVRIGRINLPAIIDIGGHTGDKSAAGNAEQEAGEGIATGA